MGTGADPGWDHDVLVVGSGFGGSVTALRLTEKGWSVGVIEAGRRFTKRTLPRTSWQLRRYLWAPYRNWTKTKPEDKGATRHR